MAKVVEDVELIMIPLPLMDKWMMEHSTWYEFVIDTYRSRFEEVLEVIDSIAFRAMDERLEFYLKRHADACGCQRFETLPSGNCIRIKYFQRSHFPFLKKMEQRGLVKLNRNQIELLKK